MMFYQEETKVLCGLTTSHDGDTGYSIYTKDDAKVTKQELVGTTDCKSHWCHRKDQMKKERRHKNKMLPAFVKESFDSAYTVSFEYENETQPNNPIQASCK